MFFFYGFSPKGLDSLYARIHGHQWNTTIGPRRVENKVNKEPGEKFEWLSQVKPEIGWQKKGKGSTRVYIYIYIYIYI